MYLPLVDLLLLGFNDIFNKMIYLEIFTTFKFRNVIQPTDDLQKLLKQ